MVGTVGANDLHPAHTAQGQTGRTGRTRVRTRGQRCHKNDGEPEGNLLAPKYVPPAIHLLSHPLTSMPIARAHTPPLPCPPAFAFTCAPPCPPLCTFSEAHSPTRPAPLHCLCTHVRACPAPLPVPHPARTSSPQSPSLFVLLLPVFTTASWMLYTLHCFPTNFLLVQPQMHLP